jgi:thiol-disulfide isomerase/thioredoxin
MRGNKKIALVVVAAVAVAVALVLAFNQSGSNVQAQNATIGSRAPNFGFLLANGSVANLSAYRGHAVVLWFVATWCPSCAQGNSAINSNYSFFKQHGIKIVELELYKDLGYSGPTIEGFVNSYAPAAYSNGTIVPALAGYNMTAAYDPKGYLDIYYLISGNGTILYISGSPAETLGQLAHAINTSL